jgi:hypothetical protein
MPGKDGCSCGRYCFVSADCGHLHQRYDHRCGRKSRKQYKTLCADFCYRPLFDIPVDAVQIAGRCADCEAQGSSFDLGKAFSYGSMCRVTNKLRVGT